MVDAVNTSNPVVRGIVALLLGAALCFYYPPVSPAVTVYVLYSGGKRYLSSNPKRRRVGTVLLVAGVVLAGFSYVVLTGYVTEPGFDASLRPR